MLVGRLNLAITEDQLSRYFNQFVPVTAVRVSSGSSNPRSRYAVVSFLSESHMQLVSQLPHELFGHKLDCRPVLSKKQKECLE